jgi:hypothetical protein
VTAPLDESLPDRVREACAWVAGRARFVRIEEGAIAPYAVGLREERAEGGTSGDGADDGPTGPSTKPRLGDREARAAFAICLDAINFGSGWWPTIRKRPGHSGFFTVAAGLGERFERHGPWVAAELSTLTAADVAAVLGQDAEHPLMVQFAASLADVGAHVGDEHGGSFAAVVDAAAGSAPALAGLLGGWDAFADVSTYEGREVPFFKRAQLASADLDRAGVADLRDLDHLTAFADNLVPHVLRVDGVLVLDPELRNRIEAGQLLEHGSPEEVELRAVAVHAVEQLAAAVPLSPAEIDAALWNRGRGGRFKSVPRPRSRNTAY